VKTLAIELPLALQCRRRPARAVLPLLLLFDVDGVEDDAVTDKELDTPRSEVGRRNRVVRVQESDGQPWKGRDSGFSRSLRQAVEMGRGLMCSALQFRPRLLSVHNASLGRSGLGSAMVPCVVVAGVGGGRGTDPLC
jgi:hypothetical protein